MVAGEFARVSGVFQRESAAWAQLHFITGGNFEGETGRHGNAEHWAKATQFQCCAGQARRLQAGRERIPECAALGESFLILICMQATPLS